MENLEDRVSAACRDLSQWIDDRLAKYEHAKAARKARGLPVLCLVGHGRSGKDTAAEYLSYVSPLRYSGSSSNNLCKFVSAVVGVPEAEAFADRHNHREFWLAVGHLVRRSQGLTFFASLMLAEGDMVVGLRCGKEMYACAAAQAFDASLWVDNPRAHVDPTVEFTQDDCDLSVRNAGSKAEFFRRLDVVARLVGVFGK